MSSVLHVRSCVHSALSAGVATYIYGERCHKAVSSPLLGRDGRIRLRKRVYGGVYDVCSHVALALRSRSVEPRDVLTLHTGQVVIQHAFVDAAINPWVP